MQPASHPRIPRLTYRIQPNRTCTFLDAASLVPYLHNLGITDLYCSPYFTAVPESMHGYDVVDPTTLNPEIGTQEDYRTLVDDLPHRGMGQLLDVVPNHMGITQQLNGWWRDVLENGPSSHYASLPDCYQGTELWDLSLEATRFRDIFTDLTLSTVTLDELQVLPIGEILLHAPVTCLGRVA